MDTHLALKGTVQATHSHDTSIRKINKLHDKLVQGKSDDQSGDERPELSVKAAVKLMMAYESAVKSCLTLQESIEHSLEKVRVPVDDMEISTVDEVPGKTIPSPEPAMRPISPQIPAEAQRETTPVPTNERQMSGAETFLLIGTLVAVLCRVDDDSESDEWMLATVKGYNMDTNMYEVEDCELIEPAEGEIGEAVISQTGQGKRRTAPLAKIIRLPQSTQLSLDEYKPKSKVLALYPGTTCLYPAQVVSPPSKRKKNNDYLVKFSDDEVPSRPCDPKFVVPMPDLVV